MSDVRNFKSLFKVGARIFTNIASSQVQGLFQVGGIFQSKFQDYFLKGGHPPSRTPITQVGKHDILKVLEQSVM
jgi:hypothetical protein